MKRIIFGLVFVLLFLAACSVPLQEQIAENDVVALYTALAGEELSYTESIFTEKDASSVADLIATECPEELGDTFARIILGVRATSLVLYTSEDGETIHCMLFKPGNDPVEYFAVADAPAEGTVMVVNNVSIGIEDLQVRLAALPENTPRDEAAIGQILNQMINDELLRQEAESVELSEEEFAEAKEAWLTQQNLTENQLNLLIDEQNASKEAFEGTLTSQTQLSKLLRARLLLDEIAVGEDDAKEFYLENPNQFMQAEQAVMRQIFISSESRTLEDVSARVQMIGGLLNSSDFCVLVDQYSDDRQSVENCGVYVIPRGVLAPDLEYAGFTTPAGQTSVVALDTGVHLVQTLQVTPAQVVPFSDIAPSLQDTLANTLLQQRLNTYLSVLRSDAEIQVYVG